MLALIVILFIGLLFMAGGLGAALLHVRATRRELSRRTDLIIHVPHPPLARARAGLAPRLTPAGAWFRRLFTLGLPYRWGMHSGAAALILIGLGGGGVAWLLLNTLFHLPFWIAGPVTVAASFLVPRQVLKMQQYRAEQAFLDLFPDTIDMVVRMVRAGLPIMAAIRTVGNEAAPPVNGVFSSLADQVDIGIMFEDALVQAGERIGLSDFRFFAVAVSLQHATGGNIASTLEILSEVIRKRRAARLKAKSTTAEVRVSAMVLGALPFLVIGGLLITSPSYLAPLVNDPRGNIIVGCAIVLLSLGFLTMRHLMRSATRL